MKENRNGSVAEWLGRALQKLVQRFESARNLIKTKRERLVFFLSLRASIVSVVLLGVESPGTSAQRKDHPSCLCYSLDFGQITVGRRSLAAS